MSKAPIHRKIAIARRAKSLTQQQLADILGVHYVTMSKLENGKSDLTLDLVIKLSDALDVSVYDFILAGPKANFNWRGLIRDKGSVEFFKHTKVTVTVFLEDQFSGEKHSWYLVQTDEFFPLIHKGDALRATDFTEDDPEELFDRLCIVEDLDHEGCLMLGVLGYGKFKGDLFLRTASGLRLDVRNFRVKASVTMVILRAISGPLQDQEKLNASLNAKFDDLAR